MEMTTISISKELREKIKEFGNKGETYTDILQKLYKSALDRQIYDLLMDDSECVSIDEAIKEAEKKWPE